MAGVRFLLDRSVGGRKLVTRLRDAGWDATTLAEYFGDARAQHMGDEEWIGEGTTAGFVLIAKDHRIASRPLEARTIHVFDARVITFARGDITAEDMGDLCLSHSDAIHRLSRVHPPFVFRLNRVIPGKENTYILDFVNDPDEILTAFQTYYEDADLTKPSDPNIIHTMLSKLRSMNIIDSHDVDGVVDAWLNKTSHNALYSHIKASRDVFWTRWNDAVEASADLEVGRLEEFRGTVNAFVRAYDFLSQILDYGDTDIEKWAIFLRVYRRVIERQDAVPPVINTDEIVLTHYRLRKLDARNLKLVSDNPGILGGVTESGSGQPREVKYGLLQDVIDKINDLFSGTGVSEVDGIAVTETIMRHVVENEKIQAEAMANTPVDFETSPTIESELEDVIYASATGHNDGIKALLQMENLGPLVKVLVAMGLYEKSRGEAERSAAS